MPTTSTESVTDVLHRGMQRARAYDWTAAIDAFRKAVALDPESVEARFRLGWALWNAAECDKPTLANMAVVYGAQVFGFLTKRQRTESGRFQAYRQLINDAIHYLNSVLDRDKEHARAYYYLAKAYNAIDRKAEADNAAKQAALLEPGNTSYSGLAQSLEQVSVKSEHASLAGSPLDASTWDDLVPDPKTKRELRQMQLIARKAGSRARSGRAAPHRYFAKGTSRYGQDDHCADTCTGGKV